MYKVRKYQIKDKKIWDSFVELSKNSTFLFKRDFMDYHKDRFVDYSLMVFNDSILCAIFPANFIDKNTIASHDGLSYGGIVFSKGVLLNDALSIIYEILFYLNSINISKVIHKAFPNYYNTIASDEIDYALFLVKADDDVTQSTCKADAFKNSVEAVFSGGWRTSAN